MTGQVERKPNRLIGEASPYLLQHAYNPVDWHPWGAEALEASAKRDCPIFLSIGYSACHWCHVMEHESFENEQIAALMNEHFVNIKVDREERPDLDQIYMNSVMALNGHGGWPMSVFLTPDCRPFFGGTYWPPGPRMGSPGFRDILLKVREAWETRREAVLDGAGELTETVVKMGQPHANPTELTESILKGAMQLLDRAADRANGGFGRAPKFPHPMDLRLLLRAWKRFGNAESLDIARLGLDKMSRGGIYDHLGGGFHRYSTDAQWLVPHFEKMLYDNALLGSAYLEAFQATREEDYARVARETLDYIIREMSQPDGGYFSTQDADSEGVEGKFFVWSEGEVIDLLGAEDARVFNYCYDVTADGNWEGATILHRVKPHAQAAKILGIEEAQLDEILERSRQTLFDVREQRIKPGRDDKVLTSWNGLMIATMAQAGQVLDEEEYIQSAQQAAEFVMNQLRTDDGRLLHVYKDGRARGTAFLDDYACTIDALVELYQATFSSQYLDQALELASQMVAHFKDPNAGGFFYTADDHETLIARNKDAHDSATPSGNGMAATALLRLARLTANTDFEQAAYDTLEMLSGQMAENPMSSGQALLALDFLIGPAHEFAIVDGDHRDETTDVLRALHDRFVPNKVLLRRPKNVDDEALPSALQPVLSGKRSIDKAATVYICQQGSCQEPVVGAEGLKSVLDAEP